MKKSANKKHLNINGLPACGRTSASTVVSEIEFCGSAALPAYKRIERAYRECTHCARKIEKQILQKTGKTTKQLFTEAYG